MYAILYEHPGTQTEVIPNNTNVEPVAHSTVNQLVIEDIPDEI